MTVIREVMTKQLVTVEPTTSVATAVTVMGMQRVGAALVMETVDDPKPRHGGPRSIG